MGEAEGLKEGLLQVEMDCLFFTRKQVNDIKPDV